MFFFSFNVLELCECRHVCLHLSGRGRPRPSKGAWLVQKLTRVSSNRRMDIWLLLRIHVGCQWTRWPLSEWTLCFLHTHERAKTYWVQTWAKLVRQKKKLFIPKILFQSILKVHPLLSKTFLKVITHTYKTDLSRKITETWKLEVVTLRKCSKSPKSRNELEMCWSYRAHQTTLSTCAFT